jgi:hypothetical protein
MESARHVRWSVQSAATVREAIAHRHRSGAEAARSAMWMSTSGGKRAKGSAAAPHRSLLFFFVSTAIGTGEGNERGLRLVGERIRPGRHKKKGEEGTGRRNRNTKKTCRASR